MTETHETYTGPDFPTGLAGSQQTKEILLTNALQLQQQVSENLVKANQLLLEALTMQSYIIKPD